MGHWFFVTVGWAVVISAVAIYTVRLLGRGRGLSGRVPPERRRWT